VSKGGSLNARLTRLELTNTTRMAKHFSEECICFPVDEQPEFKWRAEAEEAARVLCPLHGRRFQTVVKRHLYWALRCYVADFKRGWPHRSAQYQKVMRVSLDPTVASTVASSISRANIVGRDERVESDGSAVAALGVRSEDEVFNRRPQ
jgi:hypothetical protein